MCQRPIRTEDHSFQCLDAWKGDGFNWTNVALLRLELHTSSVFTHNDPGEQQVRRWAFLVATLQRTPHIKLNDGQ